MSIIRTWQNPIMTMKVLIVEFPLQSIFSTIHISSILAAIIGGVLGFASSYYIQKRKEKIKKNNIRLALISELETNSIFFDIWVEKVIDESTPTPELLQSTIVFENNVTQIGDLNREEIESTVNYYSYMLSFDKIVNNISGSEDVDEDIEQLLESIDSMRKKAIDELKNNLDA